MHWQTNTQSWGLTSGEGELNLFVDDLQGDEIVFLIESAIVEKQSLSFSGGKPAKTDWIGRKAWTTEEETSFGIRITLVAYKSDQFECPR